MKVAHAAVPLPFLAQGSAVDQKINNPFCVNCICVATAANLNKFQVNRYASFSTNAFVYTSSVMASLVFKHFSIFEHRYIILYKVARNWDVVRCLNWDTAPKISVSLDLSTVLLDFDLFIFFINECQNPGARPNKAVHSKKILMSAGNRFNNFSTFFKKIRLQNSVIN